MQGKVLNFFLIFVKYRLKALKNYVKKQLDLITGIEILLFCGFLVFYIFKIVNDNFTGTFNNYGINKTWALYILIIKIFFVFLFFSGLSNTGKYIKNIKNEILLSLPVPFRLFSFSRIIEIFAPVILSFLLLLILFIIFICQINLPFTEILLLLWLQTGAFIFSFITGMNLFLALTTFKKSLTRFGKSLIFLFIFGIIVFRLEKIQIPLFQLYFGLLLTLLLVLSFIQVGLVLKDMAVNAPESLIPVSGKTRFALSKKLANIYSVFTPASCKAIVQKDFIFLLRNYRSFILLFFLLIIILATGILKSPDVKEAVQWFLSINIAAAYLFANLSFKFNENTVENLMVIKNLPIPAHRFWLAKFWNGYSPVLWLIVLGLTFIFFKFGFAWNIILPSTAVVLFIAFTLICFQTNFALYSYPFSRYAIAWYNLYIIIAVLFFTALLFPPLTIGFLIFGYAAVFRVFKRFKTVEVLDDLD